MHWLGPNGLGSQYNAGDLMQEGTMVSFRRVYPSLIELWLALIVSILRHEALTLLSLSNSI